MMNKKVVFISIMIILLAALILPACAPAKPAAKPLSFEPETYTNDELGVTLQYPKTWTKLAIYQELVVLVSESTTPGADTAGIMVVPETSDYAKTVKSEFEADPGLKQYDTKVEVTEVKTVKLADGKTTATEAIVTAKIAGLYPMYAYTTGINKGGKTIIAFGYTLGGATKQALAKEISQTLAVK